MDGFRFVVFTDTHINASETETASPWPINRLANARARAAVAAINALKPAFAIHLGDVVQPLPGHDDYEAASAQAKDILSAVGCPLRIVPGNHDVGDKSLRWNPADLVTEDFVETFRRDNGDDRWSFSFDGASFIGINAQLINSGFPRENEQWDWLEQALAVASGGRAFVFLHYPPFICHRDEHEHYDNLGEPGRSRLLDLLEKTGAEACFSGHVHNFFYNRFGATRSYTLPAISFVRHDYSELFSAPPRDSSFGRDDGDKLGFLLVDVDASGHTVRMVRSQGATKPEAPAQHGAPHPFSLPSGGSRVAKGHFGTTLRPDWALVRGVPPSGAIDEFRRKPARDDYFLAALWECGLSQLRLPVDDVLAPDSRARVELLADDGFQITVSCYGLPDVATRAALRSVRGAFLEVVLPIEDLEKDIGALDQLAAEIGSSLFVSPLRPRHDSSGRKAFIHSIRHGFAPGDPIPVPLARSAVSGLCFRISHEDDPEEFIPKCIERAAALDKTAHFHLLTGAANPAMRDTASDVAIDRILKACRAVQATPPPTSLWLDTAVEVDRGYFPRTSLIDRRSSVTEIGQAVGLAVAKPYSD